MKTENPYNYNLPVRPDMFFGRQEDVDTLVHHLTAVPGDSFALIAGRRMGKTSLLEAARRALEARAHGCSRHNVVQPIFFDLTGEETKSASDFFDKIKDQAQATLDVRPDLSTEDRFAFGEEHPPAPMFGQILADWGRVTMMDRGCPLRLVLLLDECEQIAEQPWAPSLYNALRYLIVGQATRSLLKVVMAGSHRFLTQVRQRGSPLRNVLRYHRLGVLDAGETHSLITKPTGSVLSGNVTQTVIEQSGGHPFLIQYMMHSLWEHGLESANPEIVQRIALGFPQERGDFEDWADGLGSSGIEVYSALTQAKGSLTDEQLQIVLKRAPSDWPQALDALCYHGLVARDDDGEYCIAGRMFKQWFTANYPEDLEATLTETSPMKEMASHNQKVLDSRITWLHISDLHLRVSQAYSANIVLREFLCDIAERMRDDDLQPDFIVFTGDIAFASEPEEYRMAERFLDDLLETTGLSKECLFIVPGNHDVDRSAISALAAGAASILQDRDTINRFLDSREDRVLVLRRFHNYRNFVNRYFGSLLAFDDAQYFYAKQITVPGGRVAILGLNSAWLASSDKDRNRLVLGERQVRDAISEVQSSDLSLALMHHPFEWLQDFDRSDVEPLLCRSCDFVLHGHMHQIGLLQASTPDTDAMIIGAGACYETREYPNSYNLVQLNLNTGEGKVYLRMYSDQRGGFWAKDVVNYRNVTDGVHDFSLRP